jgi:hypothetical protein
MIMQWYENGNAAEYLSKKNPKADRVRLVSVYWIYAASICSLKPMNRFWVLPRAWSTFTHSDRQSYMVILKA